MAATGQAPEALKGNDTGPLEAGANRAKMLAYYEGADVIAQAALLAIGISDAQAFVDGNKRTALVCAEEFLYRNGWEFVGDELEWAVQLKAAAEALPEDKPARCQAFEVWTREHVRPR